MKFVKALSGVYINADCIVEVSAKHEQLDGRGMAYDLWVRTFEDKDYQIDRYWCDDDLREGIDELLGRLR
jgi:hypothetical protein